MEVLGVRLVVHIIDRYNISTSFGGGKLGNVFPIQEEGECIIEIRIGVLIVLFTSEHVVEGHDGNIRFGGALKFELNPAGIKDGMGHIVLEISVRRHFGELGGFLITCLVIEVGRHSTREHDALIWNDWDWVST
jgi:hypothetical protein